MNASEYPPNDWIACLRGGFYRHLPTGPNGEEQIEVQAPDGQRTIKPWGYPPSSPAVMSDSDAR